MKQRDETATADQVRDRLDYDPTTGIFTWRPRLVRQGPEGAIDRRWNTRWAYKTSGSIGTHGHLYIGLFGHLYLCHRLAWLLTYGEWPPGFLDHANNNPADNRIANLRLATQSQNCMNTKLRVDTTSGAKGVSWSKKRKKWVAYINLHTGSKRIYLGVFEDKEEAIAARQRAALQFFGEFAHASKRDPVET